MRATDLAGVGRTALEAGISRGAEEETATLLEEALGVPRDTTDRARGPAAAAVPPVWVREVQVEVSEAEAVVVAVDGAGERRGLIIGASL